MQVFSPKDKPTAANAAKDRKLAEEKANKAKAKEKKAALKRAKQSSGDGHQLTTDDFAALKAKQKNIVLRLLDDPMVPSLFVVMSIMWVMDAIYNWQFFMLLENALRSV